MKKLFMRMVIIACIVTLMGCKSDTVEEEYSREIAVLNAEITKLKVQIAEENDEESDKDESVLNNEMMYRIKEVQSLKGNMELKGNESLRILPSKNAMQFGNINSGKVEVIATVINKNSEEWVLVESLDPNNSTISPFGFIPVGELKELNLDSVKNNEKTEPPFFDDIFIGMTKDEALERLGVDYVEVKSRDGYFIHYFGESLPVEQREYFIEGQDDGPITNLETGVDLFIDFGTNAINGFRILSSDYSLFNKWTVGDDAVAILEAISSEYETYVESGFTLSEDQFLYDISEDYFLRIVTDPESKRVIVLSVEEKVEGYAILDTNENVFSTDSIHKRTVKYNFNWVQIPNKTYVYQLPDINSSIIEVLNSSVIWVYDSFLDSDANTWLLITTEAYQPTVGYVKLNNEMANIFPSYESGNGPLSKSIESINGVRLGDPLFAFDSVYTNQYAEYDSPFGIGRIYPYNYKDESVNSDFKQSYKILINTDDYDSAINSISVTIEGLSLESGLEVGHSIKKIKEIYSDYQLVINEGSIVVQLSDFEYLSIAFKNDIIRGITLARNLGPVA